MKNGAGLKERKDCWETSNTQKADPPMMGKRIDTYTLHPFGTKLFYKRKGLSHKYSYITLHLMSRYMDYFGVDMQGEPIIDPDSLEEDYSLNLTSHFTVGEMLKMIRDNLQTVLDETEVLLKESEQSLYIMKVGSRWKEHIHKGLVKLLQGDFLTHYYTTLDDPLLYMKKIVLEHNYKEGTIKDCTVLTVNELLSPYKYFDNLKKNKEEFAGVLCHQFYLRWLRNRFLHHSPDEHTSAGMDVPLITILRAHRGRYSNGEPNRQTYV
ncbi:MAG: hypothetical protein LUE98_08885 [Tannerellaceae bacterium]|nr:hypothetical protein [Tannerellaceae bacterium]